jgi:hypothetical protein
MRFDGGAGPNNGDFEVFSFELGEYRLWWAR